MLNRRVACSCSKRHYCDVCVYELHRSHKSMTLSVTLICSISVALLPLSPMCTWDAHVIIIHTDPVSQVRLSMAWNHTDLNFKLFTIMYIITIIVWFLLASIFVRLCSVSSPLMDRKTYWHSVYCMSFYFIWHIMALLFPYRPALISVILALTTLGHSTIRNSLRKVVVKQKHFACQTSVQLSLKYFFHTKILHKYMKIVIS